MEENREHNENKDDEHEEDESKNSTIRESKTVRVMHHCENEPTITRVRDADRRHRIPIVVIVC